MSPASPIIQTAVKYRSRLDATNAADLERLVNTYGMLAERLKDKVDLLVLELEQAGIENLTTGQVARMSRYKDLLRALAAELEKYGAYLEVELGGIANQALAQSTLDATRLISMAMQGAGITGGVNKLPKASIATLLGFLQQDSPLYDRLHKLAPELAGRIGDKILEGVGLGYNPQKVGSLITSELGWGLTDALRWARTTQMWTYREASRANFAANADVIDGWVWFALLDSAVPPCESCLAKHGEIFPLDETLDDHYNGRCVPIPHVAGDENPVKETGEEWFNNQDEETQRSIMGEGKLDAYSNGQIEFSQLSRQVEDDVWGTMRTEVPLKDLIGSEGE